jgi:hypothetical protein
MGRHAGDITHGNFLILSNGLVVFVVVRRGLENLDIVVLNIGKNLMRR